MENILHLIALKNRNQNKAKSNIRRKRILRRRHWQQQHCKGNGEAAAAVKQKTDQPTCSSCVANIVSAPLSLSFCFCRCSRCLRFCQQYLLPTSSSKSCAQLCRRRRRQRQSKFSKLNWCCCCCYYYCCCCCCCCCSCSCCVWRHKIAEKFLWLN